MRAESQGMRLETRARGFLGLVSSCFYTVKSTCHLCVLCRVHLALVPVACGLHLILPEQPVQTTAVVPLILMQLAFAVTGTAGVDDGGSSTNSNAAYSNAAYSNAACVCCHRNSWCCCLLLHPHGQLRLSSVSPSDN